MGGVTPHPYIGNGSLSYNDAYLYITVFIGSLGRKIIYAKCWRWLSQLDVLMVDCRLGNLWSESFAVKCVLFRLAYIVQKWHTNAKL